MSEHAIITVFSNAILAAFIWKTSHSIEHRLTRIETKLEIEEE